MPTATFPSTCLFPRPSCLLFSNLSPSRSQSNHQDIRHCSWLYKFLSYFSSKGWSFLNLCPLERFLLTTALQNCPWEWHWNMYNIIYEMSHQSRFDARYWMLGAGALERPRGMVWGGGREEGSGWGTHVCLWRIHFDIWQNQYNIVKFKNKIKCKKINKIKLKERTAPERGWRAAAVLYQLTLTDWTNPYVLHTQPFFSSFSES